MFLWIFEFLREFKVALDQLKHSGSIGPRLLGVVVVNIHGTILLISIDMHIFTSFVVLKEPTHSLIGVMNAHHDSNITNSLLGGVGKCLD
jgi:hypothetical protein